MNKLQKRTLDKKKSFQRLINIFNDEIQSYSKKLKEVGKSSTNEIELNDIIKLERRINEFIKKINICKELLNEIEFSSDINSTIDVKFITEIEELDDEFLEIRKSLYLVISNLLD